MEKVSGHDLAAVSDADSDEILRCSFNPSREINTMPLTLGFAARIAAAS